MAKKLNEEKLPRVASVMYEYIAVLKDEISLEVGEHLQILGRLESGWLCGIKFFNRKIGVFPEEYVEFITYVKPLLTKEEADIEFAKIQKNATTEKSSVSMSPRRMSNVSVIDNSENTADQCRISSTPPSTHSRQNFSWSRPRFQYQARPGTAGYSSTFRGIAGQSRPKPGRIRSDDPLLCVSEEERLGIVNAMKGEVTHWYRCPNGHFYGIGECGKAMVVTQCPECKARIGGRNHSLLPTNTDAQNLMLRGSGTGRGRK